MKVRPRADSVFVTAQQIASMIGFANAAAFLRARDRLENEHGFPAPMPTSRRPLKWRRESVAAWAASADQPGLQAIHAPNVALLAEARRA